MTKAGLVLEDSEVSVDGASLLPPLCLLLHFLLFPFLKVSVLSLPSHPTGHTIFAGPYTTFPSWISHSSRASDLNPNTLFHIGTHSDLSLLYFAVEILKPERAKMPFIAAEES